MMCPKAKAQPLEITSTQALFQQKSQSAMVSCRGPISRLANWTLWPAVLSVLAVQTLSGLSGWYGSLFRRMRIAYGIRFGFMHTILCPHGNYPIHEAVEQLKFET